MSTVFLLTALWVAFGVTHVALSSRALRPKLVAALGPAGFLGAYSALALAIFVPLVWVYVGHRHAGPYLGSLVGVPGMRWGMYVAMGFAFALVVGALVRPSPASVVPGDTEVRGVYRVTRHPLFMGFGIFGLLHLCVVAVNAAELVFFAGFPLFALIGTRHQDARKLAAGDPAFRRFHDATAWLPLPRPAGVLAALREQPVPIAVGVGVAAGARWLHPAMFGVG
jgi:uncharacterized membrane protein